ncbi:uncharacterized protein LOC119519130 [Choloepus didactylus]|uniref:uncharacterized protein LOC119519130 n=1 Tax=Choloepus didactylus TaxID=27675 RepID=UPI00189D1341|nr:uncharacterized protein LOC119519130 [Choloepus didactylus]
MVRPPGPGPAHWHRGQPQDPARGQTMVPQPLHVPQLLKLKHQQQPEAVLPQVAQDPLPAAAEILLLTFGEIHFPSVAAVATVPSTLGSLLRGAPHWTFPALWSRCTTGQHKSVFRLLSAEDLDGEEEMLKEQGKEAWALSSQFPTCFLLPQCSKVRQLVASSHLQGPSQLCPLPETRLPRMSALCLQMPAPRPLLRRTCTHTSTSHQPGCSADPLLLPLRTITQGLCSVLEEIKQHSFYGGEVPLEVPRGQVSVHRAASANAPQNPRTAGRHMPTTGGTTRLTLQPEGQ